MLPVKTLGNVIYIPTGPALEYSPLALNLYTGCLHNCVYCYAPTAMRKTRAQFHLGVKPRENILERLEKQCKKIKGSSKQILLCFSCDPYQPEDPKVKVRRYKNLNDPTKLGRILIDHMSRKTVHGVKSVTREALLILEKYEMKATVLTKGGTRACRDFDILQRNGWSFGTSINHFFDYGMTEWEPEPCATPLNRVKAIEIAHSMGIKTWVSLEPVIYPVSALAVINQLVGIVDHWKIGKLNHNREVSGRIDWAWFIREVERALKDRDFYIKKSLEKYRA